MSPYHLHQAVSLVTCRLHNGFKSSYHHQEERTKVLLQIIKIPAHLHLISWSLGVLFHLCSDQILAVILNPCLIIVSLLRRCTLVNGDPTYYSCLLSFITYITLFPPYTVQSSLLSPPLLPKLLCLVFTGSTLNNTWTFSIIRKMTVQRWAPILIRTSTPKYSIPLLLQQHLFHPLPFMGPEAKSALFC